MTSAAALSATESPPPVRVLGVRHHGPGSARAVLAALDAYDPQAVLIEGPPEADSLAHWAGDAGLVPPVALLAYVVGRPARSAFWPLAAFSPEWVALRWAVERGRDVRFIDLPAAIVLADRPATEAVPDLFTTDAEDAGEDVPSLAGPARSAAPPAEQPGPRVDAPDALRGDPIAVLARAAGYDDPERWWDDVIEHRRPRSAAPEVDLAPPAVRSETRSDSALQPEPPHHSALQPAEGSEPTHPTAIKPAELSVVAQRAAGPIPADDPFDAITEAMAQLRRDPPPVAQSGYLHEQRREAHMRQCLRAARREHERVAVVCGAWHAPALSGKLPPAAQDARLLRGLPKAKVSLAWVPWTHSRLAYESGYGAGIASPGWYHHLFSAPDRVLERWFTAVAGVLRRHDLPVSVAHVIEAVRLADALAALRGRPAAGLAEAQEAALAVLCDGSSVALELVTREAVVGERLGEVPPEAPLVPLEADLRASAKTLRLPFAAGVKEIVLDLRKDHDRAKSRLLHRLAVLGIPWGRTRDVASTGTFKEAWELQWRPEFAVSIVLAALWGTTVAAAANAKLADDPGGLADVTRRVEQALLAELETALAALLIALDERAAHEVDQTQLLRALPALARAVRYGTARGTDTATLAQVAHALLGRICAGLPAACAGLAPDAAVELREPFDLAHLAVPLLGEDARTVWQEALNAIAERTDVPGLLAGRVTRILTDSGALAKDEAGRRLGRALTHRPTVAERAAFAEGFLAGSALLLVHDRTILRVVDDWIQSLGSDDFGEVLPVLRRAFGSFNAPERRAIAQRAQDLGGPARAAETDDVDWPWAEPALVTVRLLLGVPHE